MVDLPEPEPPTSCGTDYQPSNSSKKPSSTYSCHLALREHGREAVEDLNGGPRRVDEVHLVELDYSLALLRLESIARSGVDDGDSVDDGEDGRSGAEGVADRSVVFKASQDEKRRFRV